MGIARQAPERPGDEYLAARCTGLGEQRLQVVLGRRARDDEQIGNLAGVEPVHREAEHLGLSRRDPVDPGEQVGALVDGRRRDRDGDVFAEPGRRAR